MPGALQLVRGVTEALGPRGASVFFNTVARGKGPQEPCLCLWLEALCGLQQARMRSRDSGGMSTPQTVNPAGLCVLPASVRAPPMPLAMVGG